MENEKVIETNGIPQCPYCKKPTKRTGGGGSVTCMYFEPVYDKNGVNINPDRNTRKSWWECLECKKGYGTSGNYTDGFTYINLNNGN